MFGTQALASLLDGPAITRLGWQAVNGLSVPFLLLMAGAVVWLGAKAREAAVTAAVAP